MGMKILDESGSLLYEFPKNLGGYLLDRLLVVARFTGEDQPEVILNDHVSALHVAVANSLRDGARPARRLTGSDADAMAHRFRSRIVGVFRDAVLSGQLQWLSWSADEKLAFVRNVLWSPLEVSDQFIANFIEEEEAYFGRVRRALGAQ